LKLNSNALNGQSELMQVDDNQSADNEEPSSTKTAEKEPEQPKETNGLDIDGEKSKRSPRNYEILWTPIE
jgi:hypothetical protein